jgi:glycerol-3-phosphate O-acyltransferase
VAETHDSSQLLVGPSGSTVVYLIDAATHYEASLLERWLHRRVGQSARTLRIPPSKRGGGGDPKELARLIESDPELFLIPTRVVWIAPNHRGRRSVSFSDIFKPGDPRDPRGLRAIWIRTVRPSRVKLVAAEGAYAAEMVEEHEVAGQLDPIESHVARRAWLALDRAERRLRGNRYKIPRFVREAILARREFRDGIRAVAHQTGMDGDEALAKAERYLREIAATHSPYVIDIIAAAIHKLYRQGYGAIRYDRGQVGKIAALGERHPVAFLPSHRSNLDRLSLQFMLWENDLPPNHTAGGINLNFFPIGPLIRRTGVFFIRRAFRDDALYKTVLRSYLDYLVEKRFPLEWYMEGGRSRSGKLLPPRLGLLSYLVDALNRGKADDIYLIPVSIAYDQIQDVPDYAREAQGKDKEKESLRWLVRAVRSLRRRYGDIHISFAEPISVASYLGSIEGDDEAAVGLQKVGFEVMHRIGQATPVTPTALMSITLLAARGSTRTAAELGDDCARLSEFARVREIETTEDLDYADPRVAETVLDQLVENGYVSHHEAIGRRVFWLDEDQMIKISYYRNMVVHFFVPRALSEMAVRSLVDGESTVDAFAGSLLRLRDLLKFEFFFAEKDRFIADASSDIAIDVPGWELLLRDAGASEVLAKMGERVAFWAVLPFLDAYQVVGDELESLRGEFNEKAFLKACLARAKMYRIEGRLISGESASQVLFKAALRLARNRGLLETSPHVTDRRADFAAEVRVARALAASGG